MNRTFLRLFGALVALVVFLGLVDLLLRVTHLAQPAPTTVHGLTARRGLASVAMLLALLGTVVGGLALTRRGGIFGSPLARWGAAGTGMVACALGGWVLAAATGGPGTGNGVVGGAAAFVLGVTALALGLAAEIRAQRGDDGVADVRAMP